MKITMEWKLAWALPVIDAINKKLSNGGYVWEWGSGSSTIWLSSLTDKLICIEHNKAFFEIFRLPMIKLIEPEYSISNGDISNPDNYMTSEDLHKNFKKYCSAIDSETSKFDVIIIDGRARPSCIKHAKPKINPGGLIILDDADRPWYRQAIDTIIPGSIFYRHENKYTAIWQCPL